MAVLLLQVSFDDCSTHQKLILCKAACEWQMSKHGKLYAMLRDLPIENIPKHRTEPCGFVKTGKLALKGLKCWISYAEHRILFQVK